MLTTVLLAATMVVGQAEEQSAYKHMKDLEFLIGTSVGEYELPEGRPKIGKAGTKITRRVSARWALNKSAIIFRMSRLVDGEPAIEWMEVAIWDPKEACIVHSILAPGGSHSTGVWSKEGDELILKWSAALADGTEYAGTGRMRSTAPGKYTWCITNCTRNGEEIPDIPVVEFKTQAAKRKRAER
jgi:hypothetical protein